MTEFPTHSTPEKLVSQPDLPEEFLEYMHAVALQLESSSDVVRRTWGKHLLEDWKSLQLMAYRVVPHGWVT